MNKKIARLRRASKTRLKIAQLKVTRLCVYRSGSHIYAQIIDGTNGRILAAASTIEPEIRKQVNQGGNVRAATLIGGLIAKRAQSRGIYEVAFDRSGYQYHGRIKALAEAARAGGLKF